MRTRAHLESGFTMAEMLIVIIIIISMAGMVIVSVPRIRELAEAAKCASNLRQIGQGLRQFAIDHQGYYPPVTRLSTRFGDPPPQLTDATKKMPQYVPWYYELVRTDTATKYGLDERVFLCPADKNYDPSRTFEDAASKTAYMSDNISYGFNYDLKFADGTPYRVLPNGSIVDASGRAKTPTGSDRYPDYYRPDEIEDLRTFIVAADSNSEFAPSLNLAISIPIDESSSLIGGRHRAVDRPGANVLFGDDHVEMWASKTPTDSTNPTMDAAKNMNDPTNRRFWTLGGD
jgi:type II secretory pathway pseudopilin PulG